MYFCSFLYYRIRGEVQNQGINCHQKLGQSIRKIKISTLVIQHLVLGDKVDQILEVHLLLFLLPLALLFIVLVLKFLPLLPLLLVLCPLSPVFLYRAMRPL